MKEFLKSFEKWFARFSSIYVILILMLLIKVDYYVYLPGNLTNISKEIAIANVDKELNGSVSSVYIVNITKPSLFTYLCAKAMPYASVVKMSEEQVQNTDQKLDYAVGTLQSDISFSNAELAAYYLLGDETHFSYHNVTILYIASKDVVAFNANTNESINYVDLVGYSIKSFDTYSKEEYPTLTEVTDYLSTIENNEYASLSLENKTDTFEVKIKKRVDENGKGIFGITVRTIYVIDNVENDLTVGNVYTQGPSGGAMQALYIYLNMYGDDLLKGRKIAGTGEINFTIFEDDVNFTKVGAIGCVEQKLYAAYIDKADVFYCPKDNYADCLKAYNIYRNKGLIKGDFRIVSVDYLIDIINDLKEN